MPHTSSAGSAGLLDALSPVPNVGRSHTAGMASQMTLRGIRRLEARRQMEESNFLHSKARAQNLNPPVDLRLLDYVMTFDDNLMCPICRCPFIDPVILAECDHCFAVNAFARRGLRFIRHPVLEGTVHHAARLPNSALDRRPARSLSTSSTICS